ncbi:MAG TPA: DNA ligase D [Acetobacteraceae bacterium]|nr:DNA ligase D [Acetobacteraceae bacterium]
MAKSPGQLSEYHAKRHFDRTAEPEGKVGAGGKALSFIVQKHDARRLHYDFRLELDGVLKSWAVTRGPSLDPREKRLAVRVEDHPLDYGGFEGTIPEGEYGGGTVMLWDRGTWEPIGDPHAALEAGKIAFTLKGERLHGRWALVRMRGRSRGKRENWLLIKEHDEYESAESEVLDAASSVLTGRSMEAIAGGEKPPAKARKKPARLPEFVEPALAVLVDEVPRDPGWIFEIKYDGYRAEIAASGADVRIHTRSGLDWTAKFPEIARAVASLGLDRALIDAEIVGLDDEGRSNFSLLQQRLEARRGGLSCFAFDLLSTGGKSLLAKPLSERKEKLRELLGAPGKGPPGNGPLFYSESFDPRNPAELLEQCCKRDLEGLIAKRADAPYQPGRRPAWLKIKCSHRQELVIIGWSRSKKEREFASLLLGVNGEHGWRYAGRVGTGFDAATLKRLSARLDALRIGKPVAEVPREFARNAGFVRPELVAEIEFAGWTHDCMVRQARFLGLREDKPPEQIVQEQPVSIREITSPKPAAPKADAKADAVAGIPISHPEKQLYGEAAVTKLDLARYMEAAGPLMARFGAERFISLVRCPRGQGGPKFFQRHLQPGLDRYWLTRDFTNKKGETEPYMFFRDPRALVEAAQMDVLEVHIWGSRVNQPEKPDRIVFDLDPAPELKFDAVREAARQMREVLLALRLESLPLLSGGKGIHVVVPVRRQHDFETVRRFAGKLSERLADAAPERFVATMSKAERTGRIFIDYFRNDSGASAVCPLSPRNRPGAPVAWPVTWEELDRFDSAGAVSIPEARSRLQKGEQPWKTYFDIRQSLGKAQIESVESE